VLIAAFVAALFLLPRLWLALLVALLAGAGGHEWARLCRLQDARAWIYAGAIALSFGAMYATGAPALKLALIAATVFWVLIVPIWFMRGVKPEQRLALAVAGFFVLIPAALALVDLPSGTVLGVLVLVWVADTTAYFVGRAWGRRKLAPGISPSKTWEGAWGGVVGAVAYAIIGGTFLTGVGAWPVYAGVAVLLGAISIVGDLFESAAKRQAGVKDSGTLLPGHGGILDRVDSATAVLPIAALLFALRNP
jgi:phosphatidate cytidylyltransferase